MKIPVSGDTALVIFPPDEVSAKIDIWRQVYDPHHKTIPPHITLAFPFMSEHKWPQNLPVLIDCVEDIRPFNITLRDLGSFRGDPLVLWLKPKDSGELLCIRAVLEERFANYVFVSQLEYIPHLTVGFFDSEDALFCAKKAIMSKLNSLHFLVDELVYIVLDDNGEWRFCDKIHLGKSDDH